MPRCKRGSTMSSATSTDGSALRPWQFFLLAGMLAATAAVILATGQTLPAVLLLSLTIVASAFAGLGAYRAVLPLVVPEAPVVPPLVGGRTRAALEREKALALRAIKDLDFDFGMGKVARPDYEQMAARLRSRAVGLMQQLDAQASYRDVIEREVQARISARRGTAPESVSEKPAKQSATPVPEILTCAACGAENDADAKFCKACGAKVAAP